MTRLTISVTDKAATEIVLALRSVATFRTREADRSYIRKLIADIEWQIIPVDPIALRDYKFRKVNPTNEDTNAERENRNQKKARK